MAIIRTGAEVSDYDLITGTWSFSTSSSNFDSRFSRVAMYSSSQTNQYRLKLGASYDDIWFHASLKTENISSSEDTTRTRLITFYNTANSRPQFAFVATEDPGLKYMFVKYDAAGADTVLIDDIAYNLFASLAKPLDIKINVHVTTGSIEVHHNDVLIGSFSGDTTIPDNNFNEVHLSSAKSGRDTYYSEVIVADETTLGMRLATLRVTSDDATVDWTGSYTDVNETIGTGVDYLVSDVVNATCTMGLDDPDSEISGWDVKSVNVSSKHTVEVASTINDVQHVVKVSGTVYTGASLSTPKDGLFVSYQTMWDTNPNTASEWTVAELTSLIAGAKVVS